MPRAGVPPLLPGEAGSPGGSRRRSLERRAERFAAHQQEADPTVVLAAAMRLLEARARTVADLRKRLERSGYPATLVGAALERLTELGLLDDGAYARRWLEARDRGRPRGERVLRHELRMRGVPADLAADALEGRREAAVQESADAPSADEGAAAELLERRAASLARVADPRLQRQRVYALLARNGFDPDVVGRVAAAWAARRDNAGDQSAD